VRISNRKEGFFSRQSDHSSASEISKRNRLFKNTCLPASKLSLAIGSAWFPGVAEMIMALMFLFSSNFGNPSWRLRHGFLRDFLQLLFS